MTLKQLINHPYCYRAIFFVGAIQFAVLGSVEIFKATPDLIYVATYLSLAVMSLIECVYLRFVVTQKTWQGKGGIWQIPQLLPDMYGGLAVWWWLWRYFGVLLHNDYFLIKYK